jgi:ATP-dependent Clp protease, protease subunit
MIIPQIIEKAPAGALISYDIFSRLLIKDRIIFVGDSEGAVSTASANILISQLLYLDNEDNTKPIHLYIQSPGGQVSAGCAIYDTMQFIKAEVHTICLGMAMSFGAVLLSAGTKGHRYALPHSRIMIHQPLIHGHGISGQETDIQIEAQEMKIIKKELVEILAKHTGKTYKEVYNACERNKYMSAQEAKEFGLIDQVIESIKDIPELKKK